MKEYKIENLRNIGIIGHSDSGKTALSEKLVLVICLKYAYTLYLIT